VFPVLNVSAAAGALEEDVGMLLSFNILEMEEFKAVGKKAMYIMGKSVPCFYPGRGQIYEVGRCVWSRCLPKRLLAVFI
jgi:hypothetical protein